MKSFLLFLSIGIVFILLFMLPSIFIPVSEALVQKMNQDEMRLFLPLLLVYGGYMAFTYWLFAKNTHEKGIILFVKLTIAHIIMYPLMGLLESLFWGDAFKGIETAEFTRIFVRFTITFVAFSLFIVLIAKPKPIFKSEYSKQVNYKKIASKIGIIALVYFVIYNLFGYFVAWQFAAVREFYTGNTVLQDFGTAMWKNISDVGFVSMHIFRGILFGIAAYLIFTLLQGSQNKKTLIMALIFGGFGFQIVLPNSLLPGVIGTAHFLETTSSMLVFGCIAAWILSEKIEQSKPQMH